MSADQGSSRNEASGIGSNPFRTMEFEELYEAVSETALGRAFLVEHARRIREEDRGTALSAVRSLQSSIETIEARLAALVAERTAGPAASDTTTAGEGAVALQTHAPALSPPGPEDRTPPSPGGGSRVDPGSAADSPVNEAPEAVDRSGEVAQVSGETATGSPNEEKDETTALTGFYLPPEGPIYNAQALQMMRLEAALKAMPPAEAPIETRRRREERIERQTSVLNNMLNAIRPGGHRKAG